MRLVVPFEKQMAGPGSDDILMMEARGQRQEKAPTHTGHPRITQCYSSSLSRIQRRGFCSDGRAQTARKRISHIATRADVAMRFRLPGILDPPG